MLPAITVFIALLSSLSSLVVAPVAPQADETDAAAKNVASLTAAVEQLGSAGSYSFSQTRTDAGGGGFRGGRGGDEGAPTEVDGRFEKNKPVELIFGDIQAWRQGREMVYQVGGEGAWSRFERPNFGEGGFGGRGEGGGRGPGAGRGVDRSLMSLQAVGLPHEILASLSKEAGAVTSAEEDGTTVLSGVLDSSTAAAVGGGMSRRMGGGGDMKVTGTFQIKLDAEGHIAMATFDSTTRGSMFGRDFERSSTTRYALSAIGTSKVVVPEGALAELESSSGQADVAAEAAAAAGYEDEGLDEEADNEAAAEDGEDDEGNEPG
jgi:hypothetical protein